MTLKTEFLTNKVILVVCQNEWEVLEVLKKMEI